LNFNEFEKNVIAMKQELEEADIKLDTVKIEYTKFDEDYGKDMEERL